MLRNKKPENLWRKHDNTPLWWAPPPLVIMGVPALTYCRGYHMS
jgi:hypothetical protein